MQAQQANRPRRSNRSSNLSFTRAVSDRYCIVSRIGDGGFSSVYDAVPRSGNSSHIAIKGLHFPVSTDTTVVEAFRREIWITSLMQHPGIVRAIATGTAGDYDFLVMEKLPETTLDALLDSHDRLDIPASLAIIHELSEALAHAHQQGVCHLDVKPTNIILADGVRGVRLIDFGAAQFIKEVKAGTAGAIMSTPAYAAPELASADGMPDHRSDIYSLGVVLWEMISGHVPFDGEDAADIFRAKLECDTTSLRVLNPRVPPELDQAVLRALSRDPDRRFQSVAEWQQALRRVPGE